MSRWTRGAALLAVVSLVAWNGTQAQDPEPKAKVANPGLAGKAPTYKLEKAPFKVEVALKGVFESTAMTEVQIKLESWSAVGGLNVLKAVEHGAAVKKGDVLLELDPEKIDRAIRDSEIDHQIAELSLRQSELELPLLQRTTPLDLEAAERARQRAEEDLRKFQSTDKPLAIESAEFSLRNSKNNLDYALEELKQLEKMYRKDLTEETEEIILKRSRNQVEMAKFGLKMAENRHEQSLKVELPRREQDIVEGTTRALVAWEKAKNSIPLGLKLKTLGLEKARHERARATEKLNNLKKDRALFTVKAPADGVVYFGRCVAGQWPGAAALQNRMQKGGSVPADEVIITIVQPKPLTVRASVEEKDLSLVAVGATGKITPAAFPEAKLPGKVEKVGTVPVAGAFEVRMSVDAKNSPVVPGMSCAIKIASYAQAEALAVPASAVFEDETADDKFYVFRVVPSGSEKRVVKVGKRSGGKAEILSGLAAGDEILLNKP